VGKIDVRRKMNVSILYYYFLCALYVLMQQKYIFIFGNLTVVNQLRAASKHRGQLWLEWVRAREGKRKEQLARACCEGSDSLTAALAAAKYLCTLLSSDFTYSERESHVTGRALQLVGSGDLRGVVLFLRHSLIPTPCASLPGAAKQP
jgi:hypothetical protein